MNNWLNRCHFGDCLETLRRMPDGLVQTCVTSPPYFGLRDYGHAGQIGLEPTPEEFVAKLVTVFREVKRVLRDDGVVFLNLGDSFGGKQLLGIPFRVAFALQADGWILRSDIVWSKPNCMPESVKDRPTKAHEYVFLLSKQGRYFYDSDAIKEPAVNGEKYHGGQNDASVLSRTRHRNGRSDDNNRTATRNARSVWAIPTSPFSARSVGIEDVDHFAVMPPKLVEPCVLAGTSERGVCPTCGAPWVRVVEREAIIRPRPDGATRERDRGGRTDGFTKMPNGIAGTSVETVGWQPSCACGGEPVPATVLDPFCGAGTVGLVSVQHGRHFIGIDLNARYLEIARRRIEKAAPVLPLLLTGD
jgi:DNA modification methylase